MRGRGRPNLGPKLIPLQKKGWRQPIYYIRWSQNGRSHELTTGKVDLREAEAVFRGWLIGNPTLASNQNLSDDDKFEAEIRATERAYWKRRQWLGLDSQQVAEDPVVYFMQAEIGGPIKIGFAGNVERRRAGLQTAQAYPIKILATIPGNRFTEQRILEQFRHLRLNGEWHRPEVELMTFIAAFTS